MLQDFTVIKVMLTAILVSMIGLFVLHKAAKVKMHIKPTKIGANVIGGLIFGAGFAFAGYCPGTGAAALGQGDIAALIFMSGLGVGSYLFAEVSGFSKRTIQTWGDKGKVTLPMRLSMNKGPFVAIFAGFIAVILFAIRQL